MTKEREKRRIVIASILKPVDDTRMFEKMGQSLAQKGGHEVTIIGYEPSRPAQAGEIKMISLGRFSRLSLSRWSARWRIFSKALALRPDVFIFTTHELIFQAILLKVIRNTTIIYDVRENYYRNILHSEGLPWIVRMPIALLVRLKEKLTAPSIDHFFLAELGYEQEFRFHRDGWTVLENKSFHAPSAAARVHNAKKLLFSGTLGEATGVFKAIALARELNRIDPKVHLTIAGYAATYRLRERIRKEAVSSSFIRLVGIDTLVPHQTIIDLVKESNAGIIAYSREPHVVNTTPTKLFEYLCTSLPIITESHWPWIPRFEAHQPFLLCDFSNPDAQAILGALTNSLFYTTPVPDASWWSEELKLLQLFKKL